MDMAGIATVRMLKWMPLALMGLIFLALPYLGFQGAVGQDSYDYLRLARAWSMWAGGGPAPPMVEHPHGLPLTGALLGTFLGGELEALRWVGLLSYAVIVLLVERLVRRDLSGRWSAVFALLACGLSPFLMRHSLVVMSDVPAMALLLGGFSATVRWQEGKGWRWVMLAVLFTALACLVRLAVLPMVGVLVGWWCLLLFRRMPAGWRTPGLVAAFLLVVGVGATPWDRIQEAGLLSDWSPMNMFHQEHRSDDGVLRYVLPNWLDVLFVPVHPGFLAVGPLLLPFLRWSDLRKAHVGGAVILAGTYLVFVSAMPYQNDRVLLLAQPFLAVAMAPAFARALDWSYRQRWRPHRAWPVLALLQLGLFGRAMAPFVEQARMERDLAVSTCARDPGHVYTHGMGAAFEYLCPGIQVTELWEGVLEGFEPGALVVVRPLDLERQWGGLPPAVNWERAREQGLDILAEREDGWCIARVR